MDLDADVTRTLNAVLMGILLLGLTIAVLATGSRSSAYARADRFSMKSRLPYGSDQTRDSVASRMRAMSRVATASLLAGAVLASALLFTPIGASPMFAFAALWPLIILTGLVGTVANVRERLFRPAPDAPRVARPRAMRSSDYLDPFRRLLPWALGAFAAASFIAVLIVGTRDPGAVDTLAAAATIPAAIIVVAVFIALPILEKHVLSRPQPATDTLELAWDDAFRAAAIGNLRLSGALAAWILASLAAVTLLDRPDSTFHAFLLQVPTWGLIALQFVYPNTGRRLQRDLYPDWLRQPLSAGGTA